MTEEEKIKLINKLSKAKDWKMVAIEEREEAEE